MGKHYTAGILLGLVLLCIWIGLTLEDIRTYHLQHDSASFPSCTGRVQTAHWEGIDDDKHYVLKYYYEVDGREYTGSSYSFYSNVPPPSNWDESRPKAGEPVLVYYKPTDPRVSALQPGVGVVFSFGAISMLVSKSALLIFALWLLIASIVGLRRDERRRKKYDIL